MSLAEHGPDGAGKYLAAGLAIVHRAHHVTPENQSERQPVTTTRGSTIAIVGRLDNRDDLMMQFWRKLGDDTSDAMLAITAYERFGTAGLAALIGDWSLAIWDITKRQLVLASDHLGTRPLYFRRTPTYIAWSSDIGELVRRENLYDAIDVEYVRRYLSRRPYAGTTYQNVDIVPAGHFVVVSSDGVAECKRHWWPDVAGIRFARPESYAEQFLEVFGAAVRCRLRSVLSVWAELSGGLDSSAVVCMADRVSDGAPTPSVETISKVSDLFPEYDERRFIRAVEQQRRRVGIHIRTEDTYAATDAARDWISPQYPSGEQLVVMSQVKAQGGCVVLSGELGDQVTANSADVPAVLRSLVRDRRYSELIATVRSHSRDHYTTAYSDLFATISARSVSERGNAWWRRLELDGTDGANDSAQHAADYAAMDRRRATMLDDVVRCAQERWYQYKTGCPRLNYTFPFADRRVIEFMSAIPTHVVSQLGRSRALMRGALRGIVPDQILARGSKALTVPLDMRTASEIVSRLARDPNRLELLKHGFIEWPAWNATCASIERNPWAMRGIALRIVTSEHWLQVRSGNREASPWRLVKPEVERSARARSRALQYRAPYCSSPINVLQM